MRNATLSIENDNVSVESDWKITHRGQITRDFPLGRCKPFSVTTKEDIAPSGEMNIIRVTSTQKLRYSVLIPNLLALLHPLIVLKIHVNHTCKKREIPEIYLRNFFWIFRKILGWECEIITAPKPSPEVAPSQFKAFTHFLSRLSHFFVDFHN